MRVSRHLEVKKEALLQYNCPDIKAHSGYHK